MAYHFDGKAIFSTRNGEYARREKIPSMRTILRSNPIEDQQTMVAKLQRDFPEVCKAITTPVTDADVYEYFDYCDAAVQGFEFLRAVLEYIAGLNASAIAKKATKVQEYVGRWKETNGEAFTYIRPYHTVTDLFTEADIEEHGVEFLTDAMMQIKRLKMQEDDDEARQSALRLQMQHAHMMHNQRNFTQLQAPARPPFPVNLPAAQGMRASSNPERGQPQLQGGPLRHLPGPPGQLPAPQVRLPIPRLTSSTEVLEHVHPGSTSRGDFHSDPATHNAMDTYNPGSCNKYVAIPSRGLPGPFSYRTSPPPTQPIPLLNRIGTFDSNLPKGKKNPKKKSSDDARMVSNTEHGPREASNGANPKQPFAPQNTQMSFHPRLPDAMPQVQEFHLSSGAVPYAGNYHHPDLPPGHQSGNGPEPFDHPSHHRQAPMQPTMEGRSRVVSNPYSPPAHELQGPTQDPRSTVLTHPIPPTTQHPRATAKGQLYQENAGFALTQVRPHASQPLDPHVFGHQFPDRRMDAQDRQDPVPEFQRAALAPMSNAGQPQFLGTPGGSKVNEVPRHPVQKGCTIWIGGLPNEFDKAAVMVLLRPCRGLVDVSEPRKSSPSKYRSNRSYAFAEYVLPISDIARTANLRNYSFLNPVDAAEALERLPQTRFPSLPEGTFLTTNYPKPRLYQPPGNYQQGNDGHFKPPASNVSPTKSHKGEESNRAGKPKNEHGRKPSKGSARGKKHSTSSSEGKTEKPSERVSAVDAGQKESGLQPDEATVIPDPHGKAGSMAHVSLSTTDGQGPKSMSQHPGVIQPDVGVETHANQVSRISGDGAHDISSSPSAKPQVQESHQATSSRPIDGRKKASKKKSKGSNKLPVPENKGSEPPVVQPASGNAKAKARAKPSANDSGKFLEDSGHLEDKGKQAGFEIGASKMTAPTVPLDTTSTLPKDSAIVDQSFLGRNPTEDDGDPPKASVANVINPSGAKDDKEEAWETAHAPVGSALAAVPLEQSEEPKSLAIRRDISNSTQGSTDTAPSVLSSAPPSSSQTERSNSITQEALSPMIQAACPTSEAALLPVFFEPGQLRDKLEASIVSSDVSQSGSAVSAVIAKHGSEHDGQPQEAKSDAEIPKLNVEPGETASEQESETSASLAPSETGKGKNSVQEELQNPTYGEFGEFHPGPIKEDPEQTSGMLIQPSPLDSDRAFLRSPARKRAPSIPPRSSSLAAPSTPIKTHQKKKPRNLTPMTEASPSRVTGLSVDGTKINSTLQTTGSTRLNLTIDPAPHTLTTDTSKDLPKPETPFLMDDGVRVAPPKINRQIEEASNADRYYAQKNNYQVFHLGNAMQMNATFSSLDSSDSASPHPSEKSTPDHSSTGKQNDLETTLREAGFRSLSDTSPFTIKDPDLALLETLDEEGNPLENRANKDARVLSWVDDKGTLGPGMSFDAWKKQNEIIEVVKKATAVKRLLAGSPAHPWTKTESHRQQLSRFVAHLSSDTQAEQTTKTEARQILKAKALLGTIPQRDSSICEMQKWSRNVSLFMEENASEPSPAYAHSRKSTTNSPSKASRRTPSWGQQQERRLPVLINKPDPQTLARKLGRDEDAFQTANTELNNSLMNRQTTESEPSPSTFGRRTPSEERLTPSVVLIPSAVINPVCKLKDLFVEMGKDRRRWSDDRHRVSTPPEEERMTNSDPELKPLGGEFDLRRETEGKDIEPEPEVKETESEVRLKPHVDKQSESKGEELGSEVGKQDQGITVKSDMTKDPASAESEEKALKNPEDPTHHEPTSQLSFDSNYTTSNEGSSGEVQPNRPRGAHSPLKRSGYSAVAGRGTDGKRGGKKEASKDPWALPQGEKPWGGGRGGKKKRGRQ